jgi:hypothetical protein
MSFGFWETPWFLWKFYRKSSRLTFFFCISDFKVRNSFIHTGMFEHTKKSFQWICSLQCGIVPYAQLSGKYV